MVAHFTFLQPFLLIPAGGRLVEATHGEVRLTSPQTAIAAAVAQVRHKAGVVPVIAACAAIGFAASLVR